MSERYRTRQLYREWNARLAAGEKPRDPQQRAIDEQEAFERRRAALHLRNEPRADLLCKHNTPWMSCTICSKPRKR